MLLLLDVGGEHQTTVGWPLAFLRLPISLFPNPLSTPLRDACRLVGADDRFKGISLHAINFYSLQSQFLVIIKNLILVPFIHEPCKDAIYMKFKAIFIHF